MPIVDMFNQVEGFPLLKPSSIRSYKARTEKHLKPFYKAFLDAFIAVSSEESPKHYLSLVWDVLELDSISLKEKAVFFADILETIFDSTEQAIYFLVNSCVADKSSFIGAMLYMQRNELTQYLPYLMQSYFAYYSWDLKSVEATYEELASISNELDIEGKKDLKKALNSVITLSKTHSANQRGLEPYALNGEQSKDILIKLPNLKEVELPRVYTYSKEALSALITFFDNTPLIELLASFIRIKKVAVEDLTDEQRIRVESQGEFLRHFMQELNENDLIYLYKMIREEEYCVVDILQDHTLDTLLTLRQKEILFKAGFAWEIILLDPTLIFRSKEIKRELFFQEPIQNGELEMAAIAVMQQSHLLPYQEKIFSQMLEAYYLSPHFAWILEDIIKENIKSYPEYHKICASLYSASCEKIITLIPEDGIMNKDTFKLIMGVFEEHRLILSELRDEAPKEKRLSVMLDKNERIAWLINECLKKRPTLDVKEFILSIATEEGESQQTNFDKIVLGLKLYAHGAPLVEGLLLERFPEMNDIGWVLHPMGDVPFGLDAILSDRSYLLNDRRLFSGSLPQALLLKRHRALNDVIEADEDKEETLIEYILKHGSSDQFERYFSKFSPETLYEMFSYRPSVDGNTEFVTLLSYPEQFKWIFNQLTPALKKKALFQKQKLGEILINKCIDDRPISEFLIESCPEKDRYALMCHGGLFENSVQALLMGIWVNNDKGNVEYKLSLLSYLPLKDRQNFLRKGIKQSVDAAADDENILSGLLLCSIQLDDLNVSTLSHLYEHLNTKPKTVSELVLKQYPPKVLCALFLKERTDDRGMPLLYLVLRNNTAFKEMLEILTDDDLMRLIKKELSFVCSILDKDNNQFVELMSKLTNKEKRQCLRLKDKDGDTLLHLATSKMSVDRLFSILTLNQDEVIQLLELKNKVHETPLMNKRHCPEAFFSLLMKYPESAQFNLIIRKNEKGYSVLESIWQSEEIIKQFSKDMLYAFANQKMQNGMYFFESPMFVNHTKQYSETTLFDSRIDFSKIKAVYERYRSLTEGASTFFKHTHPDAIFIRELWSKLIAAKTDEESKNGMIDMLNDNAASDELKHALLNALGVRYEQDSAERVIHLRERWNLSISESVDNTTVTATP